MNKGKKPIIAQLLPNTVVQIVSNPALFAGATLDHFNFQNYDNRRSAIFGNFVPPFP